MIYSVRSSSCQLDGPGADFTQSFCYGEGSVWDFVYTRRLLTNGTYRPIHDAVPREDVPIVARLREQGEAAHLVSKTHCSVQNLGLGAQTADHWVRRYVRNGSVQKLDWLVVEETPT